MITHARTGESPITANMRLLKLAWPKTCKRFVKDSTKAYETCRRCGAGELNHLVRQMLPTLRRLGVR